MSQRKKSIENPPLEERNKFQIGIIENTDNLLSLKEAAEIAGVSYKTAWSYAYKIEYPEVVACKRYPDQMKDSKQIKFSRNIVDVLRKIRDYNKYTKPGQGIKKSIVKRGLKKRRIKRVKK